jgi:hypothetical protein
MAEKPIRKSDIIEDGALQKMIDESKQLLQIYNDLDVKLKASAASAKKFAQGLKANTAGDLQKAIAAEKAMAAAQIESEKIKRAQIATEKAMIGLQKQQAVLSNQKKKQIADENNAYKRQSAELNNLRNSYKNLAAQGRENSKVARGLLQEITKLDAKLKGIDATVGQHQRKVGQYENALKGLRGTMSSVTGVAAKLGVALSAGMILRDSVNIVIDFEQANANLASVLGITIDQTEKLQEQQMLLGGSTSFTAAQVAELQTEYAKLGFTQQEILNATEGTLFLAKAAGTDLANAAAIAGSTLRGFGLDATETGRVTDVMAKSFSTTALDISKFGESMKYVAPIAKAAGLSIEETTAMLGALANAGISGSQAGTALRMVINQMAKSGKPATEAIKDLAAAGLDLSGAEEEVGRNAQTALLVLAEQTAMVDDLTVSFQNADGSAKAMAETQDNTLGGALARLQSAWEAFILNLNRGSGAGKALRAVLEFLARNLDTILSVVVKLGTAFGIYKASMLALNGVSKIQNALELVRTNGLRSMFVQQTAVNTATNAGAKAVKAFGMSMNAVPIGLLLTGITLLISEMDLFKSSTEAAAEALEKLNQFVQSNKDLIRDISGRNTAKQDAEALALINKLRAQGVSELEIELAVKQKIRKENADQLKYLVDAVEKTEANIKAIKEHSAELMFSAGVDSDIFKLNQKILLSKTTQLEQLKQEIALLRMNITDEEELNKRVQALVNSYKEKEGILNSVADAQKKVNDTVKEAIEVDTNALKNDFEEAPDLMPTFTVGTYDAGEETEQVIADNLQRVKDYQQAVMSITENFTRVVEMLSQRRIEALDREADAERRKYEESRNREQDIIELRKQGAANTEESLAFERKAQAEALREQERIARKRQRLELINTSIQAFNAAVQRGDGNPLAGTIGDITALVGFINSLPAFWEGTDTTVGDALGLKVSNGRDGILARIDKDEMVLNKDKTDALARMGVHTTDDIVRRLAMGQMSVPIATTTRMTDKTDEIVQRLDRHEKHLQAIAAKPVYNNTMEVMDKVVTLTEIVTTPTKRITNIKHKRLR